MNRFSIKSLKNRQLKKYYIISRCNSSKVHSQIHQRLQELHDQNTIDENDPLVQLQQRLEETEFERRFSKQIEYEKISAIANRHAKDSSMSEPWSGEEHPHDTSLRMIIDKVGPEKNKNAHLYSNTGFKSKTNDNPFASTRRRISKTDRLEAAQDKAVNYKLDHQQIEDKEASEFRALYAERFTPVFSFDKIKSVADSRIEESMRNNGFSGLQNLRGQKLNLNISNPHVERTEHHLNNMLVKQNILPPWIEKQNSVNLEIERFRDANIESFKSSLQLQFKLSSPNTHNDIKSTVFAKWKSVNEILVNSKITSINQNLRSYNLQAPLPTQKFYLVAETELNKIFDTVDINEEFALFKKKLVNHNKNSSSSDSKKNTNFFSSLMKFW